MLPQRTQTYGAVLAALLSATTLTSPALADDATNAALLKQMQAMQDQIASLQSQLDKMKTQQVATEAKAQAAEAKATATQAKAEEAEAKAAAAMSPSAGGKPVLGPEGGTGKTFANDKVRVTLGGFTEAAGIYRTRSESADVGSSFGGIPYPYQAGYHMNEFRGSARQSRLSLLAEGNVNDSTKLASYMEMDFLGAANTANSNESNSYNPRLRQFYATVD